jgi:hypothetical protein
MPAWNKSAIKDVSQRWSEMVATIFVCFSISIKFYTKVRKNCEGAGECRLRSGPLFSIICKRNETQPYPYVIPKTAREKDGRSEATV